MNYEETQQKRFDLIEELRVAEEDLYRMRAQYLPIKDSTHSSELSRKVAMENGTREAQSRVDAMHRELEVLGDRAKYLTEKCNEYTVEQQ